MRRCWSVVTMKEWNIKSYNIKGRKLTLVVEDGSGVSYTIKAIETNPWLKLITWIKELFNRGK